MYKVYKQILMDDSEVFINEKILLIYLYIYVLVRVCFTFSNTRLRPKVDVFVYPIMKI